MKRGLLAVLSGLVLVLAVGRSGAQDSERYSPFVGTWRFSGVSEQIEIIQKGNTVTGTIGRAKGVQTPISPGTIDWRAITFSVESPDGQRTITFQGTLKNKREIAFKRTVTVHNGGSRGENGIFGAKGPETLTATLVETRASFSGRIVDSVTGQPLEKASVVLLYLVGEPLVLEDGQGRVTGADGAFSFTKLPAGDYSIVVTKDHYLPVTPDKTSLPPGFPHYKSQGFFSWGFALNAGQHIQGSEVRLVKASVISGTVLDENGKPVSNAEVLALVRGGQGRGERLEVAGKATIVPSNLVRPRDEYQPIEVQTTTDSEGHYRLEDLGQGDYYVAAQKPWVFDLDMGQRMNAPYPGVLLDKLLAPAVCSGSVPGIYRLPLVRVEAPGVPNPTMSRGLPIFHPSAVDADRATVVHVPAGKDVGSVDLTFRATPFGSVGVSIRRPDAPADQETANIALIASGLRFPIGEPFVICAVEVPGGITRIDGVTPGAYRVFAVSRQGDHRVSAMQDVYVREGGAVSVTLDLRRGVDVRGRIHLDDAPPSGFDISKMTVVLYPQEVRSLPNPPNGYFVKPGTDGSFVVPDVIPGITYEVRIGSGDLEAGRNFIRTETRYGGETVTRTFIVKDGEAQIELHIAFRRSAGN